MKRHISIIAFLFGFAVFSTCIAICYAWQKGKRTSSLVRQFCLLHFLLLVWMGGDLARLFIDDYRQAWLVVRIEYGAICFVGWSWLVFCLNYAESAWITKRRLIYLAFWPFICYVMVLTNDWHHWFLLAGNRNFNRFGFSFYCHAFGSYFYCMAGFGLLLYNAFRRNKYLRLQTYLLILALLPPLVLNVLIILRVIDIEHFDFTPLSFNITSVIFLIGIIHYKLLNILPIALQRVVAQLKEVVIVVDDENRIIEYNQAAVALFPGIIQLKPGANLKTALELFQKKDQLEEQTKSDIMSSIYISDQEIFYENTGQWLAVNIQPIYSNQAMLGRIISLNDITKYKLLAEELNQKNIKLSELNRQLQEQTAIAEELAVVKERNRVVQDIHDTLGQTMTLLLTTLQLCKLQWRNNSFDAEVKLDQALEFANKAISQTRQALYGLTSHHKGNETLSVLLPGLINEFAASGVRIRFWSSGDEYPVNEGAAQIIYHICQEALTNTLRHGQSKYLTVKLNFTAAQLTLEIQDDGVGCAAIKPGIGLCGMERRIRVLNGRISFVSHPNAGFAILAEIPKTQLL
jgi:signal transduction histidine kinase